MVASERICPEYCVKDFVSSGCFSMSPRTQAGPGAWIRFGPIVVHNVRIACTDPDLDINVMV